MTDKKLSDKDKLVVRPDEPLPTVQDPKGRESRGYPADPRPDPEQSQGQPDTTHEGTT